MAKSDSLARRLNPWLKKFGFHDLDHVPADAYAVGAARDHSARIVLVGFFRTASSLLEELQRRYPQLLAEVAVVDFSPVARDGLLKRHVPVIYGDVSHRDTLVHAGVDKAEVLVSTVPDSLLKGTTNARLVRLLRELNTTAKIIGTADVLAQARELLDAGADYVNVPRLHQAGDLLQAVRAAREGLLDEKRAALREILLDRREVLVNVSQGQFWHLAARRETVDAVRHLFKIVFGRTHDQRSPTGGSERVNRRDIPFSGTRGANISGSQINPEGVYGVPGRFQIQRQETKGRIRSPVITIVRPQPRSMV
jgi:Trk K+ transport system NAD-binding subunit